ncbi:MAG: TrkA family potassium uptake protein [Armatimonadetes bacterium]|nr:TrkA family potassium uptake protein [Armatimonadota bacterium]
MYVVIVGGGKVGYYLSKTLIAKGHEVLLVEIWPERYKFLEHELGSVVTLGDACEIRTQEDIGIGRADVVVAVTGDDEDNLAICQMAKRRFNVPRTIARVNNPKNEDIFQLLGIDQTINSTRVIDNLLEQQIDTGQIVPLAALKRGNIEIVEVDIGPNSPAKGQSIQNLQLPYEALIISIIRENQALLPQGDTVLAEGDTVIALVHAAGEPGLQRLFEEAHL